MRRAFILAGSVSLSIFSSCNHSQRPSAVTPSGNRFVLDTFEVEVGKNVSVEHKHGPDFFLITFLDPETREVLLNAYVGGHPTFMKSIHGHEDSLIQENSGIVEVRTVTWGPDESKSRDVLMSRNDCVLAGQFHLWYRGLSVGMARRADELISRVQYNEDRVNKLKELGNTSIEESKSPSAKP